MPIKSLTVLHFLLRDQHTCMNIHYIDKILPLPLLELIPSCPFYVAGLMNLKNKCIPVIDLALSVGIRRDHTYLLNTPILLCSDETHTLGLIVDKVLGLSEIDENKIERCHDFSVNQAPFYGVLTQDTGVSLLVNISWVFALNWTHS